MSQRGPTNPLSTKTAGTPHGSSSHEPFHRFRPELRESGIGLSIHQPLVVVDAPLRNTMDATLSNDAFMECVAAMRILAANIARLGEDLLFWSTAEAGIVTVPDRFCDTSSIMAQKRNPYVLHEMRALAVIAGTALAAATDSEAGATGQAVLGRKVAEEAMWSLIGKICAR